LNKITLGNYNIFAFESLHDINEQSLIYLIENNGKTIFYGTDLLEITEVIYELLSGYHIYIICTIFFMHREKQV